MMPLGNQLGAEQDAGIALLDGVDHLGERCALLGTVAIDSNHGVAWKPVLERFLKSLGAIADWQKTALLAGWTTVWDRVLLPAMMAFETCGLFVNG